MGSLSLSCSEYANAEPVEPVVEEVYGVADAALGLNFLADSERYQNIYFNLQSRFLFPASVRRPT